MLEGLESDAANAKGDAEAEAGRRGRLRPVPDEHRGHAGVVATSRAVGTVVTKDLRDSLGEHAGPSARRQAVWGDLLGTTVPPNAVFSVLDTVPNEALIVDPASEETPAE